MIQQISTKKLKLSDYAGKQVNSWTVLDGPGFEEFYIQRETKRERYWYCRCKCGDVHAKEPSAVLNNRSLMCKKCTGVAQRVHKLEDFVNTKIKDWTILPNIEEKIINYENGGYKRQWMCRCKCGAEKYIDVNRIVRKDLEMCSDCYYKIKHKDYSNYTGRKIFSYTILKDAEDYNGRQRWYVRCNCGNEEYVYVHDLLTGKKRRCRNCWIDDSRTYTYNDYIGKKIFDFTVLDTGEVYNDKGDKRLWPVACKCGTKLNISPSTLIKGARRTCSYCYHYEKDETVPKLNKYYTSIAKGAATRAIEFLITKEDIVEQYEKQNGRCYYTDVPIKIGVSASTDRVDPNIGYVKGNIVLCHKAMNFMKQDKSFSAFVRLCELVCKNKHEVPGDVFVYVTKGVDAKKIEKAFKVIKQLHPLSELLFMRENTDALEELCIVTKTIYTRRASLNLQKYGNKIVTDSLIKLCDSFIISSHHCYLIKNDEYLDQKYNEIDNIVIGYHGKWSNIF